jgi:hypothetical protein
MPRPEPSSLLLVPRPEYPLLKSEPDCKSSWPKPPPLTRLMHSCQELSRMLTCSQTP